MNDVFEISEARSKEYLLCGLVVVDQLTMTQVALALGYQGFPGFRQCYLFLREIVTIKPYIGGS